MVDQPSGPAAFPTVQLRPESPAWSSRLHIPTNSRLLSGAPTVLPPISRGAAFLDRDGVLVEDVHYLRAPANLRILPGVAEALCLLAQRYFIIVVTNQSGIARGYFSEPDLLDIHTELVRRLAQKGAVVDAFYYCPHLPDAPIAAYAANCGCRKPQTGMILRAAAEWTLDLAASVLVGDSARDIAAGQAVGVPGIFIGPTAAAPDTARAAVTSLLHAAWLVLNGA